MSDYLFLESEINRIFTTFENAVFIVKGESGIGKTYLLNEFLDQQANNICVLKLEGSPFNNAPYDVFNLGLCDLITLLDITKKTAIDLIPDTIDAVSSSVNELSYAIPKFGFLAKKIISAYCSNDIKNQIIGAFNIPSPDQPNILAIINFLKKKANGKRICIVCDNIQWFDIDSFNILLKIITHPKNDLIFSILSITDNIQIVDNDFYSEQIKSIQRVNHNYNAFYFCFERWNISNLNIICDKILNGVCCFNEEQLDLLYQYTQGVPLYIDLVLSDFLKNGIITLENNKWVSHNQWSDDIIENVLRQPVEQIVSEVYNDIPNSRELLEHASALGEFFLKKHLDGLSSVTNKFNTLKSVEDKFKIIKYLNLKDIWKFHHYIILNTIYSSINQLEDLHVRIANYLSLETVPNYSKISLHYRLGNDYVNHIKFSIKEIEEYLDYGMYTTSFNLIEKIKLLLHITLLDKNDRETFDLLNARCLFHIGKYQDSISEFEKILDKDCGDNIEYMALCSIWLGKAYLKLSSQSEFLAGKNCLIKAIEYFKGVNNLSQVGYIYMDLIVAYAHMNNEAEAEKAYRSAFKCFNAAKDHIGMVKLQRRTVIFMENALAAPIIKQSANTLNEKGLLHEAIMAFNNSATQYIFIEQYNTADELLEKAKELALSRDDFGIVYTYNNIGVMHTFKKDYILAQKAFKLARKYATRKIDNIILDINLSTLYARKLHARESSRCAENKLLSVYNDSIKVGEYEYIVPATINLARFYFVKANYDLALEKLLSINEDILAISNYYKAYSWYSLCEQCCLINGNNELLAQLKSTHFDHINSLRKQRSIYDEYILLTMQFWSEN